MMKRKLIFVLILTFLIGLTSCDRANTNSTTTDTTGTTNEVITTLEDTTNTETTSNEVSTTIPVTETTTNQITTNIITTEETTTESQNTTQVTTETTAVQYVTITFANMTGATGTTSMEGIVGNAFSMPDDPTKDGYVFDGWYLEDTFNTMFNITEYPQYDLTVYGKWLELISIFFDPLNGSSTIPFVTGLPGDSFVMPSDPERSGYVFDGWYMDQSYTIPLTLSSIPASDTTVYAKWVEEVTVIDEMISVLENDFGFTCSNNVCELKESSWLTYTFNLNNVTFSKESIDDDPSGDEQTKTEIVVIDNDWSVQYNVSITYLSTQTASMRVTGNGLTESYSVRSFASNYLSQSDMYDDAVQFIDGPYGAGAVGFLEYILQAANLTLDDLV